MIVFYQGKRFKLRRIVVRNKQALAEYLEDNSNDAKEEHLQDWIARAVKGNVVG